MNRISREERSAIVRALVEGNSIRATCRMTGVAKGTVLKLLADIGPVCAAWEDDHNVNLETQRVQCDEIWSFVYAKEKNVPRSMLDDPFVGDVWTWTAIDAETKLVINWTIGGRDAETGLDFMEGVAKRLKHRVQLTSDGFKTYLYAVDMAFEGNIDYAMLVKTYGSGGGTSEQRYSPATCTGAKKEPVTGRPNPKHISTSYVERQNLTMRMSMRRFTRLTNAFSKKAENLAYAVALHFLYYNWARPHQTLGGRTPAMAAGLEDHVWSIEEIIGLLEDSEAWKSSQKSN